MQVAVTQAQSRPLKHHPGHAKLHPTVPVKAGLLQSWWTLTDYSKQHRRVTVYA